MNHRPESFFFRKAYGTTGCKATYPHPIPMAEAQEPQKVNTLRISGGETSRIPKKGSQESWKILQT